MIETTNNALLFRSDSSGIDDIHTLKVTPVSSFYTHYFNDNRKKRYVRSKNNLNGVGVIPMLQPLKKRKPRMELEYLQSIKKQFEYYKSVGERTFDQLDEKDFFWKFNEESNSIPII